MAETLNEILNNYIANDTTTKDKLLGAAFVVVNKDGMPPLHIPLLSTDQTHLAKPPTPRNPLPRRRRPHAPRP
jgi:hypothetical protein